ncbi:MAG: HAMP domain-containing histidine kinase [Candidatus Pacebacteria bacterium]|nr:HAMP domain-containing histidine kinase [Candidatus Paceibacterota bacterium]MBP9866461.1 HAMP domain-containing histidine kinase [Candidatus Paceibacterota bacterium]
MSLDLYEKNNSNKTANGDTLLSLASHELRTPLSIIKWYTEMLLDGDAGPLTVDQSKYLKTIQSSNQRAIDLIRSLLNVSRLDLDTFSIIPTDTDLRFLVKQIISENKSILDEKKIAVEESYLGSTPGTVGVLHADKQICLVILRILFTNAILFSKENSSISVHIQEMKQGEMAGSKIISDDSFVVSFVDSGIGIPEEDKENIFSKFFKASNAINEDSKGAGLSLYIVKLILSKTGGDVWFTSTLNKGSTFYVAFPKSGMPLKQGKTTLD